MAILKTGRPLYAIILLALSICFMGATFFPLLYSLLVPNQTIDQVVDGLREDEAAPLDTNNAVSQAKAALGPMKKAVQVGYYFGTDATFRLSSPQSPEKTRIVQAAYLAWFEKRPGPMLVAVTVYANDSGQRAYINEVDPASIARGYAAPILLFGVSLFLVRKRESPATAS